jgi:hypothetical protein
MSYKSFCLNMLSTLRCMVRNDCQLLYKTPDLAEALAQMGIGRVFQPQLDMAVAPEKPPP